MRRWIWPIAVFILVLALDQASKLWVARAFAVGESLPVVPGFLALTYVRNQGAAWGIFQGAQVVLAGLGVVAAVALCCFGRVLLGTAPGTRVLTALLVSGIVGNAIDRLWHGYVIDFLDCYHGAWHFPCFNVADSAICLAVALLLLVQFLHRHEV